MLHQVYYSRIEVKIWKKVMKITIKLIRFVYFWCVRINHKYNLGAYFLKTNIILYE